MVDSDTNDLRPEQFFQKVRTPLPSSGDNQILATNNHSLPTRDTTNAPENHGGNQDGGFLWMKIGSKGMSVPGRASVDANSQSCDCEVEWLEWFQGAGLQVGILQQDQGWSPHWCFKDPSKIKAGAVFELIVVHISLIRSKALYKALVAKHCEMKLLRWFIHESKLAQLAQH
ncbi:hypothetical protein BOTCAL_0527g00090 [Botryotinia calthae]|uniref:Uncharacterized protein n=1 Tax=Botryotinia calthae TaxID=38488 RepID=A0A4Y8CMG4_9HELO|nr:hypothetical protein BOTCAL_0527g00090 [Botryotinia calthae]